MEHGHTSSEISLRLSEKKGPNYLGDFVYGGVDGTITTFALVAGIEGAGLSKSIIIVLGFANILADGFSMAASNYSGTKAELDNLERLREIENRHIDEVPDGEREEVRQILAKKGISKPKLEAAVEAITQNRETWINYMLSEEYGVPTNQKNPIHAGMMTFIAFLLCGLVPIFPFITNAENAFFYSSLATGFTFFCIGAAKAQWSLIPWWRSGIETLLIGSSAAAIAYGVGYFIGHL
ncbi:MAG: VIT1/CCC1 transporter family protein [Rhizobiaceae bacterium]|nr:VIT1/CCC1 transporter family protein [Rhizobiaceae bacterium]